MFYIPRSALLLHPTYQNRRCHLHIALNGFWALGEMASGFLAMCLPVSPRFFQSLKQIRIPSWISISGSFFGRSPKIDGYLSQFNSPRHLAKRSTLFPAKKSLPPLMSSAGLVSSDLTPTNASSSFTKQESNNSHILCYTEISITNEPNDESKPVFPAHC